MDWLAARHPLAYKPSLQYDRAALLRELGEVRALVLPPQVQVNAELLDAAPHLRVVARLEEGDANTDLEGCQRRRVRVVQAASGVARAQAEYVLGALLLLMRRGMGVRPLSASAAEVPVVPVGREVHGSTVGLLGLTATAHAVAPLFSAMGAKLIGYDPAVHRSSELWGRLGVTPLGLADLLGRADAVVCLMGYASRYRGLFNDRTLADCRQGQYWVSVSRHELFDPSALADALRARTMAACIIDSADASLTEPGAELAGLPNFVRTPGLADNTIETKVRESWFILDRIHEMLDLPDADFDGQMSTPMPLTL
ncbi:NAD(P)-dependent oxidoreductase [Comamonas serinivorans]|nr:NAD(P)-dependent oxidoreductase [Comamonas serinivorans]